MISIVSKLKRLVNAVNSKTFLANILMTSVNSTGINFNHTRVQLHFLFFTTPVFICAQTINKNKMTNNCSLLYFLGQHPSVLWTKMNVTQVTVQFKVVAPSTTNADLWPEFLVQAEEILSNHTPASLAFI